MAKRPAKKATTFLPARTHDQDEPGDLHPPIAMLGAKSELVDLDRIYPYERNTRLHSEEQKVAQEAAMRRFGWTMPMLLRSRDDPGLIAGHLRWEIGLERLKLAQGPAIFADGWSEEMIRAYVIWDNRSAEMATWDLPTLKLELGELNAGGFDLGLTGFTLGDLQNLSLDREEGETDPEVEWQGMPSFTQEDRTAFRSLAVHFPDQAAVDAFAELVDQPITPQTRFLWSPGIVIETYADKRYIDGGAHAEEAGQ